MSSATVHTHTRSLAEALWHFAEQIGKTDVEITPTWLSINLQVTASDASDMAKRAAVDLIAEALELPTEYSRSGTYATGQHDIGGMAFQIYAPTVTPPKNVIVQAEAAAHAEADQRAREAAFSPHPVGTDDCRCIIWRLDLTAAGISTIHDIDCAEHIEVTACVDCIRNPQLRESSIHLESHKTAPAQLPQRVPGATLAGATL